MRQPKKTLTQLFLMRKKTLTQRILKKKKTTNLICSGLWYCLVLLPIITTIFNKISKRQHRSLKVEKRVWVSSWLRFEGDITQLLIYYAMKASYSTEVQTLHPNPSPQIYLSFFFLIYKSIYLLSIYVHVIHLYPSPRPCRRDTFRSLNCVQLLQL